MCAGSSGCVARQAVRETQYWLQLPTAFNHYYFCLTAFIICRRCLRHTHTQLLFVDTEGFESTGRSNNYDDRVFAVATVLSSLLIYNLPETIRGSDVSKLSFVVELAAGFYNQGNQVWEAFCVGWWLCGP